MSKKSTVFCAMFSALFICACGGGGDEPQSVLSSSDSGVTGNNNSSDSGSTNPTLDWLSDPCSSGRTVCIGYQELAYCRNGKWERGHWCTKKSCTECEREADPIANSSDGGAATNDSGSTPKTDSHVPATDSSVPATDSTIPSTDSQPNLPDCIRDINLIAAVLYPKALEVPNGDYFLIYGNGLSTHPGATVTFLYPLTNLSGNTVSNDNGQFFFSHLPNKNVVAGSKVSITAEGAGCNTIKTEISVRQL